MSSLIPLCFHGQFQLNAMIAVVGIVTASDD